MNIKEGHNSKSTPATKPLLYRNLDGMGRKHTWNYSKAVGMVGHLQLPSRPDKTMAVHQCGCSNDNPKKKS